MLDMSISRVNIGLPADESSDIVSLPSRRGRGRAITGMVFGSLTLMDAQPNQTGTKARGGGIAKALKEGAIVVGATGAIAVLVGLIPRFQ